MNVLFVDDEQRILDGLRRQLRSHRDQWDIRFAISGEEALRMLEEEPADAVVSDMRMPGMSGGALLQLVLQRHPSTIRIMLSGQADPAELVRELGPIHQYLQKPCNPGTLCTAIHRTWSLARLLRSPKLLKAATRVTALPPYSDTQEALVRELIKPDAEIDVVARIIERDPALTVKVMQLVNSAFFGTPRRIESVQQAVVLLGLKTIHAIVVSGRLFDFIAQPGVNAEAVTQMWNVSIALGESAGRLASLAGASKAVQQQARLGGVLSLVGRATLMTSEPEIYGVLERKACAEGRSLLDCETEHFQATQDDVGAYALGLWGFADELVEAVAFQSEPSRLVKPGLSHPATYLHLARVLRGAEPNEFGAGLKLDAAHIDGLGLGHLVDRRTGVAA
jgi:HD-like signal output (HDOD) protein/ActR/RegA family two-component response regulator